MAVLPALAPEREAAALRWLQAQLHARCPGADCRGSAGGAGADAGAGAGAGVGSSGSALVAPGTGAGAGTTAGSDSGGMRDGDGDGDGDGGSGAGAGWAEHDAELLARAADGFGERAARCVRAGERRALQTALRRVGELLLRANWLACGKTAAVNI